jgi:UDP-N-acetyl-D-mannosaminuronate dehydrogenase
LAQAVGGLRGKTIAALGLAYKADVDDLRESPAVEVARRLAEAGAVVRTFEPHAPSTEVPGTQPAASLEAALDGADALILLVDHRRFADLDPAWAARKMRGRVVYDTRSVLSRAAWERAGFEVHVLGAGRSPRDARAPGIGAPSRSTGAGDA